MFWTAVSDNLNNQKHSEQTEKIKDILITERETPGCFLGKCPVLLISIQPGENDVENVDVDTVDVENVDVMRMLI